MKIEIPVAIGVSDNRKMTVVRTAGKRVMFSYEKPVAMLDYNSGRIFLDRDNWRYSATTLKQLAMFLNISYDLVEDIVTAVKERISGGSYEVVEFEADV